MHEHLVDIPFSNRGVCFQTVHVILMIITFPGSGLMTLALALDRCLAVYVPLRYLRFSRGYAVLISSLGYSLALPVFVYALIRTYGNADYGNVQVFQSFHECNSDILDTGNM
jgi:NhaP-type Na+/H+ and K+/H+ antiporter